MFRTMIIISFLLLFSLQLPAQQAEKIDPEKIEVNLLSNISSFYLDGNYKVFESPFAFGLVYNEIFLQPGFYFAPVFTQDDVSLSFIIHVGVLKKLGVGAGYGLWNDGAGLVKPNRHNLFFTLGIELLGE